MDMQCLVIIFNLLPSSEFLTFDLPNTRPFNDKEHDHALKGAYRKWTTAVIFTVPPFHPSDMLDLYK